MSPEDAFRRVLAARLPAGPGWTAWIDGTVTELAAASPGEGVTLTPEEAHSAATCVRMVREGAVADPYSAAELDALAARLGGAS